MKPWSTREVLAYLDRVEPVLGKLDHFELLDVTPESPESQIQDAFHTMAAGLHPDRHRHSLTSEDRERLTIVYARIAEAYRVLRDHGERDKYLREAARQLRNRSEDDANSAAHGDKLTADEAVALLSPKAQRLFRRAQAALRTGDFASAQLNLKMALARHPQSALLRDALRAARAGKRSM